MDGRRSTTTIDKDGSGKMDGIDSGKMDDDDVTQPESSTKRARALQSRKHAIAPARAHTAGLVKRQGGNEMHRKDRPVSNLSLSDSRGNSICSGTVFSVFGAQLSLCRTRRCFRVFDAL